MLNLATSIEETDINRVGQVAMLPAASTPVTVYEPGDDVQLDVAVTECVGEDHVADFGWETMKWGGGSIVLSTAVMC